MDPVEDYGLAEVLIRISPELEVSSGGGGFAGYGSGGREPASTEEFDLKKYLPGGAHGGNRRIAESADGSIRETEIGGKFDDIFRRISKRFYHLCLNNKPLDCEAAPESHNRLRPFAAGFYYSWSLELEVYAAESGIRAEDCVVASRIPVLFISEVMAETNLSFFSAYLDVKLLCGPASNLSLTEFPIRTPLSEIIKRSSR